jgi:quinohemoprotein amine dehydrogenase beta subunit
MTNLIARWTLATTAAAVLLGGGTLEGLAKDYILTVVKPNTLVLADAAARKVVKAHEIPGDGAPGAVVPSPDGKVAYVLTNRMGSISGIDIDTGEQVFRADFDEPEIRVKSSFGLDISPDGKELFVIQTPVKLKLGEYEVQDYRIAVYNTGGGLNAKPVRLLPVPRRGMGLYLSTDGSKIYYTSWDIYVLDSKTGEQLDVLKEYNWDRPNHSPADTFNPWNQSEQSQIMAMPYYAFRTDVDPESAEAWPTGMVTLDLKTGELVMEDFEYGGPIVFSTVVNPVRRNEAYGVYTTLAKIDLEADKVVKRVDAAHTYYTVNVSSDGNEVYLGGTKDDIGVYSSDSLDRIGEIKLPGYMSIAYVRVIER